MWVTCHSCVKHPFAPRTETSSGVERTGSALESCDFEFGTDTGLKGQGAVAEGSGELRAQGIVQIHIHTPGSGPSWARDAAGVQLWPHPRRGQQLLPRWFLGTVPPLHRKGVGVLVQRTELNRVSFSALRLAWGVR